MIIIFIYLQIKNLPKGATVVDYAYMIHTEIGNKMVAAKVLYSLMIGAIDGVRPKQKQNITLIFKCLSLLQVNGNLVSPTHVLANAEVVEIITYNVSFSLAIAL